MKTILGAILLCLSMSSVSHALIMSSLEAKKIFVPKGFDDNDNVQIVLYGVLPNLCYKSSQASASVVGQKILVTFTAYKDFLAGTPHCVPMEVPVNEVINLGLLSSGDYQIIVNQGTTVEKQSQIHVNEAPIQATDDFIYANGESIERVPGTRTLILRGYNPSDCYVPDHEEWISNGTDTFAVLPIMKKIYEVCPRKLVPFERVLKVPEDLDNGNEEILIHIRVMNGKSVNHIFHVKF